MNGNNNGFIYANSAMNSVPINTKSFLTARQINHCNDNSLNSIKSIDSNSRISINKFQLNDNVCNYQQVILPASSSRTQQESPIHLINDNDDKKRIFLSNMSSLSATRLDLSQKYLLTSKLLDNPNLVLNCVQLINFLDFYFELDNQINDDSEDLDNISDLNSESNHENISYNNTNLPSTNIVLNEKNLLTIAYPCIACSMKFKYDQTFHLHLNRRSVIIRIYCNKCDTFKTFYNKCKLMYHIYSHKMSLFEPIFKSIKVESISIDRLNLNKEKTIDIDSILTNSLSQSSSLTKQSKIFQISANDSIQIKIFLKRILLNKFLLYKCCICDALFFDLKDLKQHYLKSQKLELNLTSTIPSNLNDSLDSNLTSIANSKQINRYNYKYLKQKYMESFNKSQFKFLHLTQQNISSNNNSSHLENDLMIGLLNNFSFKKLQYSTRCSMLASVNLINNNFNLYADKNKLSITNNESNLQYLNKSNVLICPECGLTFDAKQELNNFRLHLIHECFFLNKYDSTQIKCPAINCNLICNTLQDAVAHWSSNHMIKQHQCDLCDKHGIKHTFDEVHVSNPGSLANNDANILKHILTSNDVNDSTNQQNNYHIHNNQHSNTLPFHIQSNGSIPTPNTMRNESALSQAVISEINRHYFEKHRNQQVLLKLNFKCLCRSITNLNELNEQNDFNSDGHECLFSEWKSCRKHIISILAKAITSLNCLICHKLVFTDKYKTHLKTVHNIEKICVCPKCGPLKDETSLHNHLLRVHSKEQILNGDTCCYFRVLKNPNDSSKHNSLNTSYQLLNDFSIYQCVNCRLLFTSKSTFSHNCWIQKLNDDSAVQSDQERTSINNTNNNYFSPIFLKFNVNKLFEERLALIKASNNGTIKNSIRLSNDDHINSGNCSNNEYNNCKKIKLTESSLETDINL